MSPPAVLSVAAAYSLILTAAVLLRDARSSVHRVFAGEIFLFAAEELLPATSYGAVLPEGMVYWQRVLAVSALIPAVWLGFGVSFAFVNSKEALSKWKPTLFTLGLIPFLFVAVFRKSLFAGSAYLTDAGRWTLPLAWPGQVLQFFSLVDDRERRPRRARATLRRRPFVARDTGGSTGLEQA